MNPRNQPPQPPFSQDDRVRAAAFTEFAQAARSSFERSDDLIKLRQWAVEKALSHCSSQIDPIPLARAITAFLAEPLAQTLDRIEEEAKKKDAV
jgi:hypothetical protein